MKRKIIGIVGIFLIVGIIVALSGCISSGNDTKVFENQYVKFSYPANWVIVDQSEGNSIEILFFSGKPDIQDSTDPKYLGAIESGDNPTSYLKLINDAKTTQNINGRNAIVFVDQAEGTYNAVFTLSSQRVNGGLYFSLDIMQKESIFNSIKNSLEIKIAQIGETTAINNTTTNTNSNTTTATKTNTQTVRNSSGNLVSETCPTCGGAGGFPSGDHGWKTCGTCGGKGYILVNKG